MSGGIDGVRWEKKIERESIDGVWESMGNDKQVGSFLTVLYKMYECMIPMCSYILYPFFCLDGWVGGQGIWAQKIWLDAS